jgi:5-methylcytosine-specific restriction endonuclease McrA
MEIQCDQCHCTFKKKNSQIKKHKHNYCSRKCLWEWQKTHGENRFSLAEYRKEHFEEIEKIRLKSVSKPHTKEHNEKVSLALKKLGHKPPRYEKDNHPMWKGGMWTWAKRFVVKRDKGTCQICGLKEKEIMDVAHLKGHENGGVDRRYTKHNPEHLITLCPNCHRRYDLGIEIEITSTSAHLKSR